MPNLLSSLSLTAGALSAYSQALQVTQNNVANASTPGYARHVQMLDALASDPTIGMPGGVRAGAVLNARDEYAERAVRQQTALMGEATQNVDSLTRLQTLFDISGDSGLPYALNNFYQSISAWGQTPTDNNSRQLVINRANDVADAFQLTATGLASAALDANEQISQTVSQVNELAGQLQRLNTLRMVGRQNDAGLDAQVHSTLDQLSEYVNITALPQDDGSVTVMIDGQVPLVIADKQYPISFSLHQPEDALATNPDAPPLARIQAYDSKDVTSKATSGRLGALLELRNTLLPTYIGSAYRPGDLNDMAKQFADRVNQILTSGNITDANATTGAAAVPGVPLFTYNTNNVADIAHSLAIDPTVTQDKLAAIIPAAADGSTAEVSNGVPLRLALLANPQDSLDQIKGQSYTQFFASLASRIGSKLNQATNERQVQEAAVAQAQNLRQLSSGVDLNQEAMVIVQFQRAYEANSRLITVLDQLTQETINLLSR